MLLSTFYGECTGVQPRGFETNSWKRSMKYSAANLLSWKLMSPLVAEGEFCAGQTFEGLLGAKLGAPSRSEATLRHWVRNFMKVQRTFVLHCGEIVPLSSGPLFWKLSKSMVAQRTAMMRNPQSWQENESQSSTFSSMVCIACRIPRW